MDTGVGVQRWLSTNDFTTCLCSLLLTTILYFILSRIDMLFQLFRISSE